VLSSTYAVENTNFITLEVLDSDMLINMY